MMKLTEFLLANHIDLDMQSYKIHLATPGGGQPPLDAFFDGKFKEWQEEQRKRNFKRRMVIGLIELRKNKWLFAGVYRIISCEKKSPTKFLYQTELLKGQEDLIGRVVVYHERTIRQPYLNGKADGGEFYLSEYLAQKLSVEKFPGYNSVNLSFSKLRIVISHQEQTWYGALSNIKGVYLITDIKTGKLYVGSATGNSGIWQRWADYAKNGHGGNTDLKKVLANQVVDYKEYFQYSILEIADSHASDEYIIQRECHWKGVLRSIDFGYNCN